MEHARSLSSRAVLPPITFSGGALRGTLTLQLCGGQDPAQSPPCTPVPWSRLQQARSPSGLSTTVVWWVVSWRPCLSEVQPDPGSERPFNILQDGPSAVGRGSGPWEGEVSGGMPPSPATWGQDGNWQRALHSSDPNENAGICELLCSPRWSPRTQGAPEADSVPGGAGGEEGAGGLQSFLFSL